MPRKIPQNLHEFYASVLNSGCLPAEWAGKQVVLVRDPWHWLALAAGTLVAVLDFRQELRVCRETGGPNDFSVGSARTLLMCCPPGRG
ncbi:hypothetical protein [Azospirillum sp. RU38E]|uniref:hypothetical protein n=1 Tax=Azospirillum sp. RU38E TaxID=1907313 RepID=UPI000B77FB2B|nr:hypothetical protein [Azospirillum sp. RU38E]